MSEFISSRIKNYEIAGFYPVSSDEWKVPKGFTANLLFTLWDICLKTGQEYGSNSYVVNKPPYFISIFPQENLAQLKVVLTIFMGSKEGSFVYPSDEDRRIFKLNNGVVVHLDSSISYEVLSFYCVDIDSNELSSFWLNGKRMVLLARSNGFKNY